MMALERSAVTAFLRMRGRSDSSCMREGAVSENHVGAGEWRRQVSDARARVEDLHRGLSKQRELSQNEGFMGRLPDGGAKVGAGVLMSSSGL